MANLSVTFRRAGRNGNYICTPANIANVVNGPAAEFICDVVARRYAYQLSFMRGVRETEPEVKTWHGKWRVHSTVTVRDTGIYFKDNDNRGEWRRRAWRSQVREAMSKVTPSMPGFITW